MPLFYFHLRDRNGCILDDSGLDLPDTEAAHVEAVAGARSIMCEQIGRGNLDLSAQIEVTDDSGRRVLILPFTQAATVRVPALSDLGEIALGREPMHRSGAAGQA